jgi:hypothetical protein
MSSVSCRLLIADHLAVFKESRRSECAEPFVHTRFCGFRFADGAGLILCKADYAAALLALTASF